MTIQGKGFYIWQVPRCEGGDPAAIAAAAEQAGLSHVLIKIADGTSAYNDGLVAPVVQALRDRGISPLGWHYIYGYDPIGEAEIALQRLGELDLDVYVIDAEAQFKEPGKDEAARQFMAYLREYLPVFPMALSSYRYPSYHPQFPFQAFLEKVDLNMPQVYWVQAHNPGEQLIRSVREFEAIEPFRPIIPTGSAYLQGDWEPSVAEINEFLQTAQILELSAANFWEWGHTRLYLPQLWDAVAVYDWGSGPAEEIVEQYFAALNAHDVDALLNLYHPEAAHVTVHRTRHYQVLLQIWYEDLFNKVLPQATFTLVDYSSRQGSRRFTWTATSSAGNVMDGSDAFGLAAGKIVYHYTSFTVTEN
ncbi:nuclear transport factor 2 family protein [Chloroflexota bacterium]